MNAFAGIATLFFVDDVWPELGLSDRHLEGVFVPQIMSIGSGMAG